MQIMVFRTPLNAGQTAYMEKSMSPFPEVVVISGSAEYRGPVQVGYLHTDDEAMTAERRAEITRVANTAIATVR